MSRPRSSSAMASAGTKASASRTIAHTKVEEKAIASGPATAAWAPPDSCCSEANPVWPWGSVTPRTACR